MRVSLHLFRGPVPRGERAYGDTSLKSIRRVHGSKEFTLDGGLLLAANLAGMTPGPVLAAPGGNNNGGTTTTPIKHVVVIFQENISFDHYFGTYPMATNPRGEVKFKAKAGTPTVNGLTQGLIDHNQNQDKNAMIYQPVRLDPSQNYTCDRTTTTLQNSRRLTAA